MNATMILTSLRQKKVAIAAYGLGSMSFLLLYTALFPSLGAQSESYNKLIKTLPPAMLQAFGIQNGLPNNLAGFLATECYGLVWPLLMLFFVTSAAGWMLAGEVEKGTIGMWLAAPVSRKRIFWTRYAVAVIMLFIFIGFSVLSAIPIAALFHIQLNGLWIAQLSLVAVLFGLSSFAMGLLASAVFLERSKVYSISSVILLVMYVINLVAGLQQSLSGLKYFSSFYYFNPAAILSGHGINHWSYLFYGALTVICTWLALLIFGRKDISI